MIRRHFLTSVAGASAVAMMPRSALAQSFEVTRTDDEWKAMLSELEFKVMRKAGTERAFTSPLDTNWDGGSYHCRGCEQKLYSSDHKFDSGTGWPSFYQALANATETQPDRKLFGVQTEVHCDRCGSHLGHIFDDGPAPTGKRHCLNGVSLKFAAA